MGVAVLCNYSVTGRGCRRSSRRGGRGDGASATLRPCPSVAPAAARRGATRLGFTTASESRRMTGGNLNSEPRFQVPGFRLESRRASGSLRLRPGAAPSRRPQVSSSPGPGHRAGSAGLNPCLVEKKNLSDGRRSARRQLSGTGRPGQRGFPRPGSVAPRPGRPLHPQADLLVDLTGSVSTTVTMIPPRQLV